MLLDADSTLMADAGIPAFKSRCRLISSSPAPVTMIFGAACALNNSTTRAGRSYEPPPSNTIALACVPPVSIHSTWCGKDHAAKDSSANSPIEASVTCLRRFRNLGVPIKAVETNPKPSGVQLSGIAIDALRWLRHLTVLTLQPFNVLTAAGPTFAVLAALALLWWRLIDHLRVEWSINPQYAYGWAVPFLCLYLAWRRRQRGESSEGPAPSSKQDIPLISNMYYVSRFTFHVSRIAPSRSIRFTTLLLLAASWLPIRLIQEANPEWRLVSWTLAIDVIGLSVLLARGLQATQLMLPRSSDLIFPLAFMLLAVPWPSNLEQFVVQWLSRSTASLTSEVLNLAGIPAVQQGNLLEVRAGVVGIEEACCGIRSFQAALMLAAFFGECYRLNPIHRLWLVLAGGFLAYGSNIARTSLLATIAARHGMTNLPAWHDPAGLFSSLGCFIALAVLAHGFSKRGLMRATKKPRVDTNEHELASICVDSRFKNSIHPAPDYAGTGHSDSHPSRGAWRGVALLVWLLLVDAVTSTWYRAHESSLPAPIRWSLAKPTQVVALDEKPLSPKAKQMLRFDTGQNITWKDAAGRKWQAIFLYWAPGRIAARLAKDHTPAICLSAAGRSLLAQPKADIIAVAGLRMRVDRYVASDYRLGKVHVLYCIREDRCGDEIHSTPRSVWHERIAPVLAGRRNSGQRSLELAVWGIDDESEARRELIAQMQRIVQIPNAPNLGSIQ